jgi:hypothetical protein
VPVSVPRPNGTPEATFKVTPKELAKPVLVSRGHEKISKWQLIGTERSGSAGYLSQGTADPHDVYAKATAAFGVEAKRRP